MSKHVLAKTNLKQTKSFKRDTPSMVERGRDGELVRHMYVDVTIQHSHHWSRRKDVHTIIGFATPTNAKQSEHVFRLPNMRINSYHFANAFWCVRKHNNYERNRIHVSESRKRSGKIAENAKGRTTKMQMGQRLFVHRRRAHVFSSFVIFIDD